MGSGASVDPNHDLYECLRILVGSPVNRCTRQALWPAERIFSANCRREIGTLSRREWRGKNPVFLPCEFGFSLPIQKELGQQRIYGSISFAIFIFHSANSKLDVVEGVVAVIDGAELMPNTMPIRDARSWLFTGTADFADIRY